VDWSHSQPRLAWYYRLAFGLIGSGLLLLLGTAFWLSPNSEGTGTHRQLGLPPCTMVAIYGTRCPACGMTTSWAHLTRGNLVGSFRANSAGLTLGLLAIVVGPWLVSTALWGRWTVGPPDDSTIIGVTIFIVVVMLADWILRLTWM